MRDPTLSRTHRRLLLLTLLIVGLVSLVALDSRLPATGSGNGFRHVVEERYLRLRNSLLGPPLVGIQVGHLDAQAHPAELASLRVSTGGRGGGIFEVEVNQAVAQALARRLHERGVKTEVLPATVPRNYRADAVVAIHADSSPDPERRGYKSATYQPERNRWDEVLRLHIDRFYLEKSGLPDDDANVTGDMLEYYAFNGAFRHSLARSTPAVIVELGYLSHPLDRRLLLEPDTVAALLESGIVAYLQGRGRLLP